MRLVAFVPAQVIREVLPVLADGTVPTDASKLQLTTMKAVGPGYHLYKHLGAKLAPRASTEDIDADAAAAAAVAADAELVGDSSLDSSMKLLAWDGLKIGNAVPRVGLKSEPVVVSLLHLSSSKKHGLKRKEHMLVLPRGAHYGELATAVSELVNVPTAKLVLHRIVEDVRRSKVKPEKLIAKVQE